MGVDLGDYDGDGDEDLFVTNFSDDYHTLYRNEGDLLFTDVSAAAGLDPATRPSLGWGGDFFDFDGFGFRVTPRFGSCFADLRRTALVRLRQRQ